MSTPNPLYIGLISGTSVDGIDAVIIEVNGEQLRIVQKDCFPLPPALTQSIQTLCSDTSLTASTLNNPSSLLAKTHQQLGVAFASAAISLLDKTTLKPSDIIAIGSHGQTVKHQPPQENITGFSLQIGCPNVISRQTGIPTISDFRSNDMKAGGQGAPLAPVLHAAIAPKNATSVFLNLGGIANITLIRNGEIVCGYDSGPANTLMDAWIQRHQKLPYDKNGEWAATGMVNNDLLQTLCADPYFGQAAPKSTGREYFHLDWLMESRRSDDKLSTLNPADVQATLLMLTATTVADEITKLPHQPAVVYCCGGGSHNQALLIALDKLLPHTIITNTAELGIDPDYVEAVLFAWLAKKHMEGEAVDLRAATGAQKVSVLGVRSG